MKRRGFLKFLLAAPLAAAVGLRAEPQQLSVPIQWSSVPCSDADKIALVEKLLADAMKAHDDMIEQALFSSGGFPCSTVPQTLFSSSPKPGSWTVSSRRSPH